MTWKEKLKALHPCPEAYRWACQYKTFRQAWRACEDGGWMWWLVSECNPGAGGEMDDVLCEIDGWGVLDWREEMLQEAYIILDFMPDPPVLP